VCVCVFFFFLELDWGFGFLSVSGKCPLLICPASLGLVSLLTCQHRRLCRKICIMTHNDSLAGPLNLIKVIHSLTKRDGILHSVLFFILVKCFLGLIMGCIYQKIIEDLSYYLHCGL
jgi:hypothetical protein